MTRTAIVFGIVLVAACSGGGTENLERSLPLGAPRPELESTARIAFENGRELFERRFARAEGHGPDFNATSCVACHGTPAPGGSATLFRNVYHVGHLQSGRFVAHFADGRIAARTFSHATPRREAIPDDAIVAQRNVPPLFGVGPLSEIPEADILAHIDPFDEDLDGISGRVNVMDGRIGRFGWKAQAGDVESIVREMLAIHLGITTSDAADSDDLADPELGAAELADLVTFVVGLAPPAAEPLDEEGRAGEALFAVARCDTCHIPNLVTDGPPVYAYTDLLLHDMGRELEDNIEVGLARRSEFRTAPLWGVRHHAPYLHDGRAATLDEAVRAHGGEALGARVAYERLTENERAALIRFLETR